MNNYRFDLSSEQTLKLEQLRACLAETLPAGDIEEEYPTTHFATCGDTCLYACDSSCLWTCQGTCWLSCANGCTAACFAAAK